MRFSVENSCWKMITGVRSLGSAAFHRQTCKCLFSQNEYLILLRKIHHRCLGTNITLDSLIIKNNLNNLYKKQIWGIFLKEQEKKLPHFIRLIICDVYHIYWFSLVLSAQNYMVYRQYINKCIFSVHKFTSTKTYLPW